MKIRVSIIFLLLAYQLHASEMKLKITIPKKNAVISSPACDDIKKILFRKKKKNEIYYDSFQYVKKMKMGDWPNLVNGLKKEICLDGTWAEFFLMAARCKFKTDEKNIKRFFKNLAIYNMFKGFNEYCLKYFMGPCLRKAFDSEAEVMSKYPPEDEFIIGADQLTIDVKNNTIKVTKPPELSLSSCPSTVKKIDFDKKMESVFSPVETDNLDDVLLSATVDEEIKHTVSHFSSMLIAAWGDSGTVYVWALLDQPFGKIKLQLKHEKKVVLVLLDGKEKRIGVVTEGGEIFFWKIAKKPILIFHCDTMLKKPIKIFILPDGKKVALKDETGRIHIVGETFSFSPLTILFLTLFKKKPEASIEFLQKENEKTAFWIPEAVEDVNLELEKRDCPYVLAWKKNSFVKNTDKGFLKKLTLSRQKKTEVDIEKFCKHF